MGYTGGDGGDGASGGKGGDGGDGGGGGFGGGGGGGGQGGAAGSAGAAGVGGVGPYGAADGSDGIPGNPGTDGAGGGGNNAGFGAGNGASAALGGGGGGGLGAGGDIFVAEGGKLTIDGGLVKSGSVFDSNGGNGAIGGAAFGSGIFIEGDSTITLSAAAGQTLVVAGQIVDEQGVRGTGTGALKVAGSGTVELDFYNSNADALHSENLFKGGIEIEGRLDLAAPHAAGSGAISFDPGTLAFSVGNTPANRIDNFVTGDKIEIDGFHVDGEQYTGSTLTLTGTNGAKIKLDIPGHHLSDFMFAPSGDNTDITSDIPCFCRGTLILTDRGEVPVEELSVGDSVVTLGGAVKPIRWIGFGRTLVTPRNRCDVSPVIVRRNALADNAPHRDLHLTRRHAILVEDVLVPVEHLINGVSVMWDNAACVVEYYHIELDDHDVLLADGAPAESFRDDDSRHLFQNERCRPPRREAPPPYRPVVTHGAWLDHAWRTVAARVGPLPAERLTDDPALHLMIDGRRIAPSFAADDIARFSLDRPPSGDVEIVSRSCIPAAQGLSGDLRRLGVGVTGLTICCSSGRRAVPLAADALAAGFHEFEGDIRWTKGRGVLPAGLFADIAGAIDIELRLAGALRYPRGLDGLAA